MKTFLALGLILSSFAVFADHHEENMEGKNIDEIKTNMTQHIDQRIAQLNETKSCISAATTKDGLKECRQKAKAERQTMKEQWQQKKAEWKSSHQKQKKN